MLKMKVLTSKLDYVIIFNNNIKVRYSYSGLSFRYKKASKITNRLIITNKLEIK